MLVRQYQLQTDSFGITPAVWPSYEKRAEYIRWNVLALEDELHEAMGEVSWKPWAVNKGVFNRDEYLNELADAFHFLLNLILVAQTDGQTVDQLAFEFFMRYMKKADVNAARQASGTYDGRSTKCGCKRAIEDGSRMTWLDKQSQDPASEAVTRWHAYECICGTMNYLEAPA